MNASGKQALFEIGKEVLLRTRRNNQPLSLLVFVLDDLPELQLVFGTKVAKLAKVAADTAIAELLRLTTSKAMRRWTNPTVCAVLLPHFTRDQAIAAVHDGLGKPCRIEFDAHGYEIVLVPEFRVETIGDESSIEEVYESLCREIDQALLSKQRRQKYLKKERESHVQHAKPAITSPSLAQTRPARPILQADYFPMAAGIPIPATIPIPLSGR